MLLLETDLFVLNIFTLGYKFKITLQFPQRRNQF